MLDFWPALAWLALFSTIFTIMGLVYTRSGSNTLEDFIVARNSQSTTATVLTLMASSLGAWILFSPAQAASWGGLAAITGYALGAMAPRLVMIPLGTRMRALIPHGHTLTEFVIARYGRAMYALTMIVMLFYMFIALTAEITAMAKLMTLVAPIPLWLTAAIVLASTLIYTSSGGLRASIFTDKLQMLIIMPLLCVLVVLGWRASGGATEVATNLQRHAPQLLDLGNVNGLKAGITFFVAIVLTGIFHQGNWQRIYAARSDAAMRRGFMLAGVLVAPVIFIMGLFGLAFAALEPGADSSVAVFSIVLPSLPLWLVIALIPLGLALVMSSADTVISAVSSMIAIDVRRLIPQASTSSLMLWSRTLIYLLAVPVLIVAAQGYSVLYLFLLADLFCAAAAFPVFFGLFNPALTGRVALASTLAGLAAGLILFPGPHDPMDNLLAAFLLAALAPVAVTAILMQILPPRHYDLTQIHTQIRRLDS